MRCELRMRHSAAQPSFQGASRWLGGTVIPPRTSGALEYTTWLDYLIRYVSEQGDRNHSNAQSVDCCGLRTSDLLKNVQLVPTSLEMRNAALILEPS